MFDQNLGSHNLIDVGIITMFQIANAGSDITRTNYWDSPQATAGYYYLSWNAGVGRLLVPDAQIHALQEMQGAKEVIISRGPWADQANRDALELLWEDGSETPFVITLVAQQCDRMLPATNQGGGFMVTAWTRSGKQDSWNGRYREVLSIPCMQPWKIN